MEKLIYDYFITKDFNCAEAILCAANEAYGLGLREGDYKLVSAFGGGLGCERTCGALCGAMAVIGCLKVKDRAHATEGLSELCAGFVESFERQLGSIECDELKAKYRNEQTRCLKTVELAARLLDSYLKESGTAPVKK